MQHLTTYLVLVLSILIFVASGETAWRIEAAEPCSSAGLGENSLIYAVMCLLSFIGLASSFYCFLSLTHSAKKELKEKEKVTVQP